MLMLLSPAKKQHFTPASSDIPHSHLLASDHTATLVALLKSYSSDELANLMHISDALATLNHNRFLFNGLKGRKYFTIGQLPIVT